MNCPNCKSTVAAGARFCSACGSKLDFAADTGSTQSSAERRHLTIMFSDLASSTQLSEQLDPEDMREILREYQTACTLAIKRHDGYVAQFLGDGVLAYFGYPQAHEDDPQRGVAAGLAVVEAIRKSRLKYKQRFGVSTDVRVSVHTGLVVVGDMGGANPYSDAIVGKTPNLAARIQSAAALNTVAISDYTHKLVKHYFDCRDLGQHHLKGIAEPVRLYRAINIRTAAGRITALGKLTPLTGRTAETQRLISLWSKAEKGQGQVVMLSGEAGVGKSRIVLAAKELAAAQQIAWVIEMRCSSHHMNSALYPVIEYFEREVFRFALNDTPKLKLKKLNSWLASADLEVENASELMADLLSISQPKDHTPLNLTPVRQKERTLDMLIQVLLQHASTQPVLLAFEDLHWADPSTLELLDKLIESCANSRILCLFTYRPAFAYDWRESATVSHLELLELPRTEAESIIRNTVKGKELPAEVVRYILQKTDGIPLFLEELTWMMIENDWLIERGDGYVLTSPLYKLPVPVTLQDSLASRLDRLKDAKHVAQLAATIGREFTHDMLYAIPGKHHDNLSIHLEQLVSAGLLIHTESSSSAHYMFKHALIQDSAYSTLLISTRKKFHRAIAGSFETQQPELIDAQPEIIAHHYTEADVPLQAIGYWQKAGERALQRSAMPEAISHLSIAAEQCAKLPEGPERLGGELMAQTYLGLANMQLWGYAHPEVEKAFSRARALCKVMGDPPQIFPVLHGLVKFRLVCGEYIVGLDLARQLQATAEASEDVNLLIEALYVVGAAQFWMGNSKESIPNLEKLISLYDPVAHAGHALVYGEDPYVTACSHNLWQRAMSGNLTGAMQDLSNAERRVKELDHPWSTDYMYTCKTHMLALLSEYRNTEECAIVFRDSAIEHGFPWWVAAANINLGWAIAHRGQVSEGLELATSNVAMWRGMGAELAAPQFYLRVAEIHLLDSNPSEALIALDEAIVIISNTKEGLYEAEIHRVKGEVLSLLGHREDALVEVEMALELATLRDQHLWLVRASMSHIRLSEQARDTATTIELLKKAIEYFTGAEDFCDFIEARKIIENVVIN